MACRIHRKIGSAGAENYKRSDQFFFNHNFQFLFGHILFLFSHTLFSCKCNHIQFLLESKWGEKMESDRGWLVLRKSKSLQHLAVDWLVDTFSSIPC